MLFRSMTLNDSNAGQLFSVAAEFVFVCALELKAHPTASAPSTPTIDICCLMFMEFIF